MNVIFIVFLGLVFPNFYLLFPISVKLKNNVIL